MELVRRYVGLLNVLIDVGISVQLEVEGRLVSVIRVEVHTRKLRVFYLTPLPDLEEKEIYVRLSTPFTVIFDNYPMDLVNEHWPR